MKKSSRHLLERASIHSPATLTFDTYEPGTNVVLRSFGRLDFDAYFADILREAKGTIAVTADCNRMYRLYDFFKDDMMCVVGLAPCTGDIGGPLTVVNKEGQEAVVALHSWNVHRCNEQYGGFTRLSSSQDFLKPFVPDQDVCKRPVDRPTLT
ncbi:hypothetical protein LEN26_008318 [Aphanomyces euteiches]|nr:hypothetical protein AeMF1_017737 [Aphanomyces euteiches]KAH9130665.1 hypothetical protein LEN26_008318 [Aphanomyces euteiches]KAH9186275.1 hypothetical protein AeNC1_011747 [Aphanomyces euteiches]